MKEAPCCVTQRCVYASTTQGCTAKAALAGVYSFLNVINTGGLKEGMGITGIHLVVSLSEYDRTNQHGLRRKRRDYGQGLAVTNTGSYSCGVVFSFQTCSMGSFPDGYVN